MASHDVNNMTVTPHKGGVKITMLCGDPVDLNFSRGGWEALDKAVRAVLAGARSVAVTHKS